MKTTKATAAATVALAAILAALPACGDLKNNGLRVQNIAYIPDGSVVLFNVAGTYIFDGLLQTQKNYISLDALAVPPLNAATASGVMPAGILDFSLSADGSTAAISFSPNDDDTTHTRFAIYRIPDGELLNMFQLDDTLKVADQALSPDGTRLAAMGYVPPGQATIRMLDTATGAVLWSSDGPGYLPVWSPDGTTLFSRVDSSTTQQDQVQALDARTGASKWTTDPTEDSIDGLALTGNGALLATAISPALAPSANCPVEMKAGDCPPFYPFWSATDGTAAMQVPAVPHTWLYAGFPSFNFACNATDTCASGLNYWNDPDERSNFIHIYKTDGTVLWNLPTPTGKAIDDMAISPDGNFITIANPYDLGGGASVYTIYGQALIASHLFPVETF